MMNKQMLSILMIKIVPKQSWLQQGYIYTHLGVRWPDCFSLVTRVATTVMSHDCLLHLIPSVQLVKIGKKYQLLFLGNRPGLIKMFWSDFILNIKIIYKG